MSIDISLHITLGADFLYEFSFFLKKFFKRLKSKILKIAGGGL